MEAVGGVDLVNSMGSVETVDADTVEASVEAVRGTVRGVDTKNWLVVDSSAKLA